MVWKLFVRECFGDQLRKGEAAGLCRKRNWAVIQAKQRSQLPSWGVLELDGPAELSPVRTGEWGLYSPLMTSHCMWAALRSTLTLGKANLLSRNNYKGRWQQTTSPTTEWLNISGLMNDFGKGDTASSTECYLVKVNCTPLSWWETQPSWLGNSSATKLFWPRVLTQLDEVTKADVNILRISWLVCNEPYLCQGKMGDSPIYNQKNLA